MNYLAHIYLSGSNTHHALGNFIADDIKGLEWKKYPIKIQEGILLHRAIDSYTDKHALFKKHVSLLFPIYRHYSRVIVDMYFDHFLALHWEAFHNLTLNEFSMDFYSKLKNYDIQLSDELKRFITALIDYDWFEQYKSVDGLRAIMAQMDKRTRFDSNLALSTNELVEKYPYFELQFLNFIKPLIAFSKLKTTQL